MKRKLMLFSLWLAWASLAFGGPMQFLTHRRAAFVGGGGGGPTYLFTETWEATGLGSWTKTGTGTMDPDTSVSVPGMSGAQCLRLNWSSSSGTLTSSSWTAATTCELYFQFYMTTAPGTSTDLIFLETAADVECLRLRMTSANKFDIRSGGGTIGTTTDAVATGTLYNVWLRYVAGSGANAQVSVEFSTTSTRSGSGNKYASSTNGLGTAGAERIQISSGGARTMDLYYDNFYADDADISSVP
jgi:hypothetical protein